MTEHLKKNEAELNELLSAYWAVRHDAGEFPSALACACLFLFNGRGFSEVYMETLADKLGIDLS